MRVAWRVMAALALVLAGAAILLSSYLFTRIQDERENSIRNSCQETNRRYDKTIATLDKLIAQAPPERKQRARENRAGTVLLINALVPKRDCESLVDRSVRPSPK